MAKDNPDFDYTMGVEVDNVNKIPQGMRTLVLPKGQYISLTFVKRGPDDVEQAFGYLFKTWMPKSTFIPTGTPLFIYYDDRFFSIFNKKGYVGNPIATIYVPIKPFFIKKILKFLRII